MPNLFLSHSSIDKPFVEKLACDLKRLGVNVWLDKWEIRVGDSITWKIEEGIRENEFLGLVLSPEAVASEWVKSELSAAWFRQMQQKKISVLPILYRDCHIPLFLSDRKYADFRQDYQHGLEELAACFGIQNTKTLSLENWRKFYKKPKTDWQTYREAEFRRLVTVIVNRARQYNWSVWVGGTKNPLSLTCYACAKQKNGYVSLKLTGTKYAASFIKELNPNNIPHDSFTTYVGNSVEECEEFVWRKMEDFKAANGNPTDPPHYATYRFGKREEKIQQVLQQIQAQFNWYDGDISAPDKEWC